MKHNKLVTITQTITYRVPVEIQSGGDPTSVEVSGLAAKAALRQLNNARDREDYKTDVSDYLVAAIAANPRERP